MVKRKLTDYVNKGQQRAVFENADVLEEIDHVEFEEKIDYAARENELLNGFKRIVDTVIKLESRFDVLEEYAKKQITIIRRQAKILESYAKRIETMDRIYEQVCDNVRIEEINEKITKLHENLDRSFNYPKETVRIIERDELGRLQTITEVQQIVKDKNGSEDI